MIILHDGTVVCYCSRTIDNTYTQALGVLHRNAFYENTNCKRLYVIGGILIISCLICGCVYIDPTLVKEFRSKNQTESQGE